MDWLRKYVLHNWGLKLVSLAVAVLLWMAVTRDPVAEVALNVPVEFHNAPEQLEISSETIPEVQVRVRGPVREVRELAPTEVHAVVDLSNAQRGERTYDLSPGRIRVPAGVQVIQAIPSQIRISFDSRETRRVPLKPRVVGTLLSGYKIVQVTAQPDSVTIVGPAKHVEQVDSVSTDPFDATGLMGTQTLTKHAYVSDPLVRLVEPGPIHVTVVTEKTEKARGSGGK